MPRRCPRLAAITALALALAGCVPARSSSPSPPVPISSGETTSTEGPGPGALLRCQSSGKNAYDTYGMDTFVRVNQSIRARATSPASRAGLGDSARVGTGDLPATVDDADTFEGKLAAYLVYAYGGPRSITYADHKMYVGPQDMKTAHKGLGITMDTYRYFISNIFVPALTDSGVAAGGKKTGNGHGEPAPDDVGSCFAPLVMDPAFVATIVGQ
jgi:hypothetical protein